MEIYVFGTILRCLPDILEAYIYTASSRAQTPISKRMKLGKMPTLMVTWKLFFNLIQITLVRDSNLTVYFDAK